MAENKRASMNARVAVPRVSSPQIPQALGNDTAIARAIGAKVQITTTSRPPRQLEGYLFSAHIPSNVLALTSSFPPSANTTPAMTVVPITSVQTFTVVSYYQPESLPQQQNSTPPPVPPNTKSQTTQTSQPQPTLPALPPLLDATAQQARLRFAMDRAREADARRGKGVTKEAQEIFDALSRTLPTRWDGQNIIVLDQVLINKPYRVEDVKGGKDTQNQVVQRIKKVLENEKQKIANRNALAAGVRKGG